jgi:4-amino-4-deoxy-L-arabinose transferase-like glycosyltransferase
MGIKYEMSDVCRELQVEHLLAIRRFTLPIRRLRWVFAALYLLVMASLWGLCRLLGGQSEVWGSVSLLFGVIFLTQLIFLAGAGTIELCRPIRRRRIWLPILVASLLLTVLLYGASAALIELFDLNLNTLDTPVAGWLFGALLIGNWLLWIALFYVHCRNLERYRVLKRLTLTVLGGSLLELLVSVPSHLIVSRRPGCFVGMGTAAGIAAGLCVLFWSFGPGIVLMFYRERYQREQQQSSQHSGVASPKGAAASAPAPSLKPGDAPAAQLRKPGGQGK